jgi:hypothetical protein
MRRASALLVLVLVLVGCRDPYAAERATTSASTTTTTVAEPAGGGSSGDAARTFATRWVNWDWRSAADQQRTLARLATGHLARDLTANARSARVDATLVRDRPGSRGTVAAVDLTTSQNRASGIVVTREQALTDGNPDLGGSRYRVYLPELVHNDGRWEVSAWQPQP